MEIIEIEKTLFFSSSEINGACNVRDRGSRFEVTLGTPLTFPLGSLDCSIECISKYLVHYAKHQ